MLTRRQFVRWLIAAGATSAALELMGCAPSPGTTSTRLPATQLPDSSTAILAPTSTGRADESQSQSSPSPSGPTVAINVNLKIPLLVTRFSTGVTHTQYSLDPEGDAAAIASGKQLLAESTKFQNQHIMGWGAEDPEPTPGNFNWTSLDRRVQLMRDTHGEMVLTLCGAPGWMRPSGYQDDWANLETAPDPAHVQDFADLAKAVALRYPDVKYFQVWNELKGMWGTAPGSTLKAGRANRWDFERYTSLYNAVYTAIKSVRPDAQVGGPYVTLDTYTKGNQSHPSVVHGPYGTLDQRALDVVTYWLAHKRGADFITVDGNTKPKDGIWVSDDFSAGRLFQDAYDWIRSLDEQSYPGARTLPIWWAEWYAEISQNNPDPNYRSAVMTSGLLHTLRSGASAAFIWGPQGNSAGLSYPEGLWTDTRVAGGGQPTKYYYTQQAIHDYFPEGTTLMTLTSSDATGVDGIASATKALILNKTAETTNVSINQSTSFTLAPFDAKLVDIPT